MRLNPPEWRAILDSLQATACSERFLHDPAHKAALIKVLAFARGDERPDEVAKVYRREDVDLPQHPLRSVFVVLLGPYVIHESWTCASAQLHADGVNAEIAKATAEGRV